MFIFHRRPNVLSVLASLQVRCVHGRGGRNHYTVLGLTPKASQGDIKKAYYKLSMKHHPDKTEGSETKFREITSAYEVLGNVKLRRLYDQGIFRDARGVAHTRDEMETEKQTVPRARHHARGTQPSTGKTAQYDFDEWSRMHYSNLARKNFEQKERNERIKQFRQNMNSNDPYILIVAGLMTVIMIVSLIFSGDPDSPRKRPPRDNG